MNLNLLVFELKSGGNLMKKNTLFALLVLIVVLALPQALQAQTHTISGQVVNTGEVGVDGVTITFFDGVTTETEITSGGGYYTHTVNDGWRGTVTPSQTGYTFTPTHANIGPVDDDVPGVSFIRWIPVTISGNIQDTAPAPLGDVLISLSTGETTTTNAGGNYSITVESGWSGTITPSKAGYAFTPTDRTYSNVTTDQTGQNYVGDTSSATYTISGTVDDGATNLAGVTMSLSTGGSTTTNGSGYYEFTVDTGWSGTITPSMTGYTFAPVSRSYTNVTANQTAQDFTGTASVVTYTVSGTVYDVSRTGMNGVTVTFSGLGSTTTAGDGTYSYSVATGWSGTITPSYSGSAFTPASRSVGPVSGDITEQNFDEVPDTVTISGTVTDGNGIPLVGVTMTPSTGAAVDTDSFGEYTLTLSSGWSGTVTPSRPSYTFSPTSRTYSTVTVNQTGQDYTGTTSEAQYEISGRVADRIGAGVANIMLVGLPGSPVTDASGNYSALVDSGWSGTVSPSSSAGYIFSPASTTYSNVTSDQLGQDYGAESGNPMISGTISKPSGVKIRAAFLIFSNGAGMAITDRLGNYTHAVPTGWSGTVTPSKQYYVFDPTELSYNNVNSSLTHQDFTGTIQMPDRNVTGTVTDSDGIGIPGVVMNFSNDGGTVTTDSNGDYLNTVPYGWSGTVTPFKNGFTFTPSSLSYSNLQNNQYGQDFVGGGAPYLTLSPTTLNFGTDTYETGPQTFMVSNTGIGTIDWTVSQDQGWISCSPTAGSGAGVVTVTVDSTGLATGTYTGTITVSDPGASNSPQTVSVQMNVYGPGGTSIPFGEFSTPEDGSTVMSSIPVTGWALDDIGVESVKIYREDNGSLAYIGDAVFVEGARPDVEAAYPGYPNNSRAGWGYMMLTNFLPGGGNGTYTLHAIAVDVEGNEVTLGTKTITCDNANAVKPFGAIDTPSQGGEASGADFINYGWVLTPQPNSIPTDGSTINVYVDGVNLGNPVYNNLREDIAALFPGYNNSDGAVGYFQLDTTAYTNGVHTIYWTATDDAGNTDGIGSRYFTIYNAGSRSAGNKFTAIDLESLNRMPMGQDFSIIEIKELKRVKFKISGGSTVIGGYLMVGNELRPLPVGSTLDAETGTFYWLPGPAFAGDFRLVFVMEDEQGSRTRRDVMVKIGRR
jgi:hypothetical protein